MINLALQANKLTTHLHINFRLVGSRYQTDSSKHVAVVRLLVRENKNCSKFAYHVGKLVEEL